MHQKRSYGRMLLVSVLVGCLEVALAVVVVFLYVRTQPPSASPVDHTALVAGLFSFGVIVGIIAFLLSLVFVLPAVALADLLGRRIGGREAWWWVPPAVAAVVAPPIAAFAAYNDVAARPVLVFWAVATASLSAGGVVARPRHPGLVRQVGLWGTAVVAGTGILGTLGFAVGLLPAYAPPAIGPASLAGTWGDQVGGRLVFTSDGRVTASGVSERTLDDTPTGLSPRCSGSGTWSYEPGRGVWTQKVHIYVPECSWSAWAVGGTDREPRIYQHVGHPDSGKRYELRKAV